MQGRGPLKSAAEVGFLHSRPQGGHIAAIIRGSDPCYAGSSPARPAISARVVKLDWHRATNAERKRMQVRVLSRVPFLVA